MKHVSTSKVVVSAFVALFALTLANPGALAQSTRTWVSGLGDDVNPGSRTAPCKTFAGAISKTAAGGEIDCIDPGGFGSITITKSITIDGGGTFASILSSGTTGVTINAAATDVVTLRNLSINGATTGLFGIRILSAAEVNIEDCVIFEFGTATSKGIDVASTVTCKVNIKNTIVRGCTAGAVHVHPTTTGTVVTLNKCDLNDSQFGLGANERGTVTLDDCVLSGNGVGVSSFATGAAANVMVSGCTFTKNTTGVLSRGATSTVRISDNTISQNGTGIAVQMSGQLISFSDNVIKGNTTDLGAGAPTSTALLQ